ncbi:peptidylprolyl isomerase [Flagellimonas aquimarina]|uniref:Peptidyl-prolyl cis-trans isomerase n=1 Tax=Flagellimonas aquimarina TaxID=2201895 RepID=A0A316KVC7_9FLAO|nr:peptidylprolyl isomerase [Allomuricauda koreensis]PWL37546.1 peptidylprolyl isomerase [Allomuricauda koreensis]
MFLKQSALTTSILLFFLVSCGDSPKKNNTQTQETVVEIDSVAKEGIVEEVESKEEEAFVLNEENAIDFFFNYAKDLKEDKVRLTTSMGSFTVQLFDDVPYHKANFIYLTQKGYFDNTQFHRVVKDFIIQGGNSDDKETPRKRRAIGRYLLPPDAKKGHKHHRGVISMPSSERDNPHKLASPYEFFIVVTKPGSYHLDGSYTPFGKVISGMDVVDAISNVDVGDGDWPWKNVYILKAEIL